MLSAPQERIRAHQAAAILGIQIRTVQSLAQRGELPGACKIGGLWTFDEAALRGWISDNTTHRAEPVPQRHAQNHRPRRVRDSINAAEEALRELRRMK